MLQYCPNCEYLHQVRTADVNIVVYINCRDVPSQMQISNQPDISLSCLSLLMCIGVVVGHLNLSAYAFFFGTSSMIELQMPSPLFSYGLFLLIASFSSLSNHLKYLYLKSEFFILEGGSFFHVVHVYAESFLVLLALMCCANGLCSYFCFFPMLEYEKSLL